MSLWQILENATFAYEEASDSDSDEEVRHFDSQQYTTAQLLQKLRVPPSLSADSKGSAGKNQARSFAKPVVQCTAEESVRGTDDSWIDMLPDEIPSVTPQPPEPRPTVSEEDPSIHLPTQFTQESDSTTQRPSHQQPKNRKKPTGQKAPFDLLNADDSDDDFDEFFSAPKEIELQCNVRKGSTAAQVHFSNVLKYVKTDQTGVKRLVTATRSSFQAPPPVRRRLDWSPESKPKKEKKAKPKRSTKPKGSTTKPEASSPRKPTTLVAPQTTMEIDLDGPEDRIADISDFSDDEIPQPLKDSQPRANLQKRLFLDDIDTFEDFGPPPPKRNTGMPFAVLQSLEDSSMLHQQQQQERVKTGHSPLKASNDNHRMGPVPQLAEHPEKCTLMLSPPPRTERKFHSDEASRLDNMLDEDIPTAIPFGACQRTPQKLKKKMKQGTPVKGSQPNCVHPNSHLNHKPNVDIGEFSPARNESGFPLSKLLTGIDGDMDDDQQQCTPRVGVNNEDAISSAQEMSQQGGTYFTSILDKPHDSPSQQARAGAFANATPSPKLFKPRTRRGYHSNCLCNALNALVGDFNMWQHKLHKLNLQVTLAQKANESNKDNPVQVDSQPQPQQPPHQPDQPDAVTKSNTTLNLYGILPLHFMIVHVNQYRSEYGLHSAQCTVMFTFCSQSLINAATDKTENDNVMLSEQSATSGTSNNTDNSTVTKITSHKFTALRDPTNTTKYAEIKDILLQYHDLPIQNTGEKVVVIFTEEQKHNFNFKPGSLMEIHQPWQEVSLGEYNTRVIFCTYFMRGYRAEEEVEEEEGKQNNNARAPADGFDPGWQDECEDVA